MKNTPRPHSAHRPTRPLAERGRLGTCVVAGASALLATACGSQLAGPGHADGAVTSVRVKGALAASAQNGKSPLAGIAGQLVLNADAAGVHARICPKTARVEADCVLPANGIELADPVTGNRMSVDFPDVPRQTYWSYLLVTCGFNSWVYDGTARPADASQRNAASVAVATKLLEQLDPERRSVAAGTAPRVAREIDVTDVAALGDLERLVMPFVIAARYGNDGLAALAVPSAYSVAPVTMAAGPNSGNAWAPSSSSPPVVEPPPFWDLGARISYNQGIKYNTIQRPPEAPADIVRRQQPLWRKVGSALNQLLP